MTTINDPELQRLRAHVAELWRQYRDPTSPPPSDEPGRAELKTRFEALAKEHESLSKRRDELRRDLELRKLRASRFVPLMRACGWALGAVAGVLVLSVLVPLLPSTSQPQLCGAAFVTLGLTLVGLAGWR